MLDGLIDGLIDGIEGRVKYLLTCCPDLGPIGQAFAALKRLLRVNQSRTFTAPKNTVGSMMERRSPEEC